MTTVSVVMPAFNAAATVGRAVTSILAQTFTDWELIVVDDGSFDTTAELVAGVADHRVRVLQVDHGGVSAARNAGAAVAGGALLTFLDADDEAEPTWLAKLTAPLLTDSTMGLATCAVRRIEGGQAAGIVAPSSHDVRLHDVPVLWLSGAWMIRTELFRRTSGYDGRLAFGENTDVGGRVADALRTVGLGVATIDAALVRWHDGDRHTVGRARDRADAAELTLQSYTSQRTWRSADTGRLQRIVAVNAARLGQRRRALRFAWRATLAEPTARASWSTLAGVLAPVTARRWRRLSTPAPAPMPAASPSTPLISVLLPVHNGVATVDAALDSILAQDVNADFEVVVVDDGSTDDTPAVIAARAADPRIRIATHDVNRGLVAALNTGLRACRGALVARLDADDTCLPGRLAAQLAVFRRHADVVLCASDYVRVSPSGEERGRGVPPPTHAELAVWSLTGNRICHSTAMFRRDAAAGVGGYRDEWATVEDYDLWLRLIEVGRFAAVPEVLVRYCVNPEGVSSTRAIEQRRRVADRARAYRAHLLGEEEHDGPVGVGDVARCTAALLSLLALRHINTGGLDRAALMVANAVSSNRHRWIRRLSVLTRAPRPALRGRCRVRVR